MCVEQPNNQATDRANGEIIFVALLTVSVIGIGAVGVSLGNDVTKDTTQRMQTPEFELDDRSDMEIAYEEGPLINNEEETETISLFDGENEYVYTIPTTTMISNPGNHSLHGVNLLLSVSNRVQPSKWFGHVKTATRK